MSKQWTSKPSLRRIGYGLLALAGAILYQIYRMLKGGRALKLKILGLVLRFIVATRLHKPIGRLIAKRLYR